MLRVTLSRVIEEGASTRPAILVQQPDNRT
jgi:hypothetical protein